MTISNSRLWDHHRISQTARVVAYCRSFSDIPYAKDVSEAVRGEDAARVLYCEDFDMAVRHAGPFLEARYKSFNPFTAMYGNVLELAVGASVERGLSICNDNERIYVGTDLPEMIEEARKLCSKIDRIGRSNHRLEPANVISYDELGKASIGFGERRNVLIICEGLWGFLSSEEQAATVENIRRILMHYGGQWVTPDFFDLESMHRYVSAVPPEVSSAMSRIGQRLRQLTGRVVEKNLFASKQEARRFFQSFGFKLEQHPMVRDVRCISSLAKLWGDQERTWYEQVLAKQLIHVMSIC